MSELSPELIRRVLVATQFDYSGEVYWSVDLRGVLRFCLDCSDFFALATADCEPVETQQDVELLEKCLADLITAEGTSFPTWLTELYATRRRRATPPRFMVDPAHERYIGDPVGSLFREAYQPA